MSHYYADPRRSRRNTTTPASRHDQDSSGRVHSLGAHEQIDPPRYLPTQQMYEDEADEDDLFAEDEADRAYELDVHQDAGLATRKFGTSITRTLPDHQSTPRRLERHVSRQYARQPLLELPVVSNATAIARTQMQAHRGEQYNQRTSHQSTHYDSDSVTPADRHREVTGKNEVFPQMDRYAESRLHSTRGSTGHINRNEEEPAHLPTEPPTIPPRFRPEYLPVNQSRLQPQRSQIVRGIELISPRVLPNRLRSIFSFPNFNAIQSKCFNTTFRQNDNFVLSSPTGSGKTVIFELAICRLISTMAPGQFKIVYQAPTKSLCAERYEDWTQKFAPFDMTCAELTGDSTLNDLKQVSSATIIVTTPEKWDSITRKWRDQAKLMKLVKLFLIDEVHMLKETRGATLEAVVSRMKSMGTGVRFIALSATVPNLEDVAEWLGNSSLNPHVPASQEQFGEDFRPVSLERHVVGHPSASNPWSLDKSMSNKITDIIAKYSKKKPIMVFCITRKLAEQTAQALANWWATKPSIDRSWALPDHQIKVTDSGLKESVSAAVAFHHAGLSLEDREAVESGYKDGSINVICCTSTLAVGVNLPCHFVIIKGTQTFEREYSDLEIMQMLGRAGRPQYDSSAIAVIMTSNDKVALYKQMISGQEKLESRLHTNLIDHLNAEICLETVRDLQSAKTWLQGTFFYVRLKRNASHYLKNGHTSFDGSYDDYLEHILRKDIALLQDADLITSARRLAVTRFGEAAARYYVQFETARILLNVEPRAKLSEVLSAVCQASEFSEIRFKTGDKSLYKELNQSTQMRFAIKGSLSLPAHKVSIIVQTHLGCIDFSSDQKGRQQFAKDSAVVFNTINRLVKCYIDFQNETDDAVAMRNALMLSRSLAARCWDDSPLQLRQIEGIGPASVRKLVGGDVKSVEELDACNASKIEALLNKNPPFGMKLLENVGQFPRLRLSLQSRGQPVCNARQGARINVVATIGFLNDKVPRFYGKKPVYVVFVAETSDGKKVFFARSSATKIGSGWDIRFDVNLINPLQELRCYVMCDEHAGTLRSAMIKPTVPSAAWPRDVAGLPNFKPVSKNNKKPSMNTSVKRNSSIQSADDRRILPSDPLDGMADDEIAEVIAGATDSRVFHDIEEVLDQSSEHPHRKPNLKKTPTVGKGNDNEEQPIRLPNGNWACRHLCKDKTRCQHKCCKSGMDHRPKAPTKRKLLEDQADGSTQSGPQVKKSRTQSESHTSAGQLKGQTKISLMATKPKQRLDVITSVDLSVSGKPVPGISQKFQKHDAATQKSGVEITRPLPSIEFSLASMPNPPRSGHRIETIPRESLPEVQADQTDEEWGEWPDDVPLEDVNVGIDDRPGYGVVPRDASQEVDSLLDEALIGLADSQYLQTSNDDIDAQEGTSYLERPLTPEVAPPAFPLHHEAEQSGINDSSQLPITDGRLRIPTQAETTFIHANRTDKSVKGPSIAQMFAQDNSSSFDDITPQPASRSALVPGTNNLAADDADNDIQGTQAISTAKSQKPSAEDTPQISAWLIAEFGKYVDFV